jgi:hypothetical protein
VDLTNLGVVPEAFGGDVQVAMVSARTGAGLGDLMEKILLQVMHYAPSPRPAIAFPL